MKIKALLFKIFLLLNFTIASAQNIIYISSLESDDYTLYELDLSDCSLTEVTKIQTPVFDITFHPNGKLYGLDSDGRLWEINIATGEVELIHTFESSLQVFNSMTANNDGLIYVTGDFGDFYSYNLQTEQEIFYGVIPNTPSGDFTFYQGNLYVATDGSGDDIIQVNITNPSSSQIVINQNLIGDIFGIVSDAFDCSDVTSYAMSIDVDIESTNIYQIDFESSSLQFLCEIGVQVGGGASTYEFLSSTAISIDNIIADLPTSCFGEDGYIEVIASGGIGLLEYSLNGIDFQSNNQFTNLSTEMYVVTIRDENNCITVREIDLRIPPLVIDEVIMGGDECDEVQRSFTIRLLDDSRLMTVTVNDSIVQSNLDFQNYDPGIYQINISDEFGCEIDTTIEVTQKFCALYIPNAFSPNGDGYNDFFKIYPHPLFEGEILAFYIFDRWGNVLYENKNYDFEQDSWDGTSNGKPLNPSVFVYMVRVDYGDGLKKTLSGDVTLLD